MNIIPNQKKVIADLIAGRAPNPDFGKQAKTRSRHNNYLTLPVLFLMISGHYPLTFMSPYAWVMVGFVLVAGAVVRHFYNERHAGRGDSGGRGGLRRHVSGGRNLDQHARESLPGGSDWASRRSNP